MPSPGSAPLCWAVFDFDGTLTRCDTLLPIVRSIAGRKRFWGAVPFMAWHLGLAAMGLGTRDAAKADFLRRAIGGTSLAEAHRRAQIFHEKWGRALLLPDAVRIVEEHGRNGTTLAIVSASPELFVAPFAAALGAHLLGTKLTLENGMLNGSLDGKNCRGAEKVRRLDAILPRPRTDCYIHAYGDSAGDHDLLAMADQSHYRAFNNRWKDKAAALVLFLRLLA